MKKERMIIRTEEVEGAKKNKKKKTKEYIGDLSGRKITEEKGRKEERKKKRRCELLMPRGKNR